MGFQDKIDQYEKEGKLPPEVARNLRAFLKSYKHALADGKEKMESHAATLSRFLDLVVDQVAMPFSFAPHHQMVTQPFDFHQFCLDFFRPMVLLDSSSVKGLDIVDSIVSQLSRGENVILFSNHQTEPDSQAITLLLEKTHPKLAQEMIFVAGHRVITDPVAAPLSKGLNLLCIFSRNYIEHPPEKKREKVAHNQRTMKKMRDLLSEGGKCIWVAPSGGRDRPNAEGIVNVAEFDPQAIEMFWFVARHSSKPTRFYPLALETYNLMPPPNRRNIQLGEPRSFQQTPIHLTFGHEIDMMNFSGSDRKDKKERRSLRAKHIWNAVEALHREIRL